MNFEDICRKVIEVTRETGNFIRNEKGNFSREKVEVKGLNDFVSYVDKTSEKMLVEALEQILPEAGFIAEEGTSNRKGETYNWIIDPLDGTTNFIHGLYPFAISIALQQNDELVMGVIYEIGHDEMFYAWKGSKAYLNDKEISVTKTEKIKDAFVATGFPYSDFGRFQDFLKSLEYFITNTPGVRRIGSAATDMAYVACGRFDTFYEYSLSPWDVAAGIVIVQQAGGKICDFNGGDNYLFGKEIIASNTEIFDEFKDIVKSFMYPTN